MKEHIQTAVREFHRTECDRGTVAVPFRTAMQPPLAQTTRKIHIPPLEGKFFELVKPLEMLQVPKFYIMKKWQGFQGTKNGVYSFTCMEEACLFHGVLGENCKGQQRYIMRRILIDPWGKIEPDLF